MSAGVDIFTGLAPLLRVRPVLEQICVFGAQWAAPHGLEEPGWAPFHIVTEGECELKTYGERQVLLKTGDVAVLPHGDRHIMQSRAGMAEPGGSIVTQPLPNGLACKRNVPGEGDTQLVCGRLKFEQARDNMLLAALPAVVVVEEAKGPQAARIGRLVAAMREELDEDGAGSVAVAADLATAIITIVLRVHFERTQASAGVIALMANRQTGRALAAMLDDLARDWTLDELAAEAAASRATLVRLFQKLGGAAPLAFLSELRLGLAQRRLHASRDTLADIAEAAGYQSESAFSRAYKNRFGIAPGVARKAQLAPFERRLP